MKKYFILVFFTYLFSIHVTNAQLVDSLLRKNFTAHTLPRTLSLSDVVEQFADKGANDSIARYFLSRTHKWMYEPRNYTEESSAKAGVCIVGKSFMQRIFWYESHDSLERCAWVAWEWGISDFAEKRVPHPDLIEIPKGTRVYTGK